MKLEKLDYGKGSKSKYFLYGFIMCALLLILLNVFTSKAKYKQVDKVELIRQNITYSAPDLNIMAVYKEDEQGDYQKQDEIPTEGYELDKETSYCTISNDQTPIKDILDFQDGTLMVDITRRNTKCYLYFEKENFAKDILQILGLVSQGNIGNEFTGPSCNKESENCGGTGTNMKQNGLYETRDDYGKTYYFRGSVDNNWVQLGNTYWRIIRINGNGTIRLIFSGLNSPAISGTDTIIGKEYIAFNSKYNDNAYVGLMYGAPNSESYDATHHGNTQSVALTKMVTWYNQNLKDKYEKVIDGGTGFCGDRSLSDNKHGLNNFTNKGYNQEQTLYKVYDRTHPIDSINWSKKQTPTLKCSNISNDLYTTEGSSEGNKILPVPMGMISADEVIYAGGFAGSNNENYWLRTENQNVWTMTPYMFLSNNAYLFGINKNGGLGTDYIDASWGIRAVINLKSDTTFQEGGNGTIDNPFIVKTE